MSRYIVTTVIMEPHAGQSLVEADSVEDAMAKTQQALEDSGFVEFEVVNAIEEKVQ